MTDFASCANDGAGNTSVRARTSVTANMRVGNVITVSLRILV